MTRAKTPETPGAERMHSVTGKSSDGDKGDSPDR